MGSWRHRNDTLRMIAAKAGTLPDPDRLRFDAHAAECARCQHEGIVLRATLDVLREGEPPSISSAARQRMRTAFLDQVVSGAERDLPSSESVRRRPGWLVPALATLAALLAAAIVGMIYWPVAPDRMAPETVVRVTDVSGVVTLGSGGDVLEAGDELPYDEGQIFRSGSGATATLNLSDDLSVTLGPSTEVMLSEGHISLVAGELTVVTKNRLDKPWIVETSVASFRIADVVEVHIWHADSRGGVDVKRGEVLIEGTTSKEPSVIRAGESWHVDPAPALDEDPTRSPPSPTLETPEDVPEPPGIEHAPKTVAPRPKTAAPRPLTATAGEKSRVDSKASPARAMEVAERYLLKRDYPRAVEAFLGVTLKYPRSSFAEEALFISADILARRMGDEARARRLLDRYLREYPRGRFRAEALGLVERIGAAKPR